MQWILLTIWTLIGFYMIATNPVNIDISFAVPNFIATMIPNKIVMVLFQILKPLFILCIAVAWPFVIQW